MVALEMKSQMTLHFLPFGPHVNSEIYIWKKTKENFGKRNYCRNICIWQTTKCDWNVLQEEERGRRSIATIIPLCLIKKKNVHHKFAMRFMKKKKKCSSPTLRLKKTIRNYSFSWYVICNVIIVVRQSIKLWKSFNACVSGVHRQHALNGASSTRHNHDQFKFLLIWNEIGNFQNHKTCHGNELVTICA